MFLRSFVPIAIGLLAMIAASVLHGQDTSAAASPNSEAQQIDDLIKALDDDQFSKRAQATEALAKLGAKAVPALRKATADKQPEVSKRAFQVLDKILSKGDPADKAAAAKALTELAASKDTAVAKGAKEILERKPEVKPVHLDGVFGGGPDSQSAILPGRLGGRVEIHVIGAEGTARTKIRYKGKDGKKDIEVIEKDRTITIREDKTEGVAVTVTEEKDGKKVVNEYKAKDVAELKKEAPAGYEHYAKYADQKSVIQGGLGERIGIRYLK